MNSGRNNMNENSIKKENGEKKNKHSRRGGPRGVPRGYRPPTAGTRGVPPPNGGSCSAKAERCERSVAAPLDKPVGGVPPPNDGGGGGGSFARCVVPGVGGGGGGGGGRTGGIGGGGGGGTRKQKYKTK